MAKKKRCIRAGIQDQQQLPPAKTGKMNRDNQQRGQRYFVWRLRWCRQGDVPSFHSCLHPLCVVEAKHTVRIVHQHVEMPQKIPSDNAAKVEIGCLERLEVLHQNGIVDHRL